MIDICVFKCEDDPVHEIRRLHPAKKECGFDRLISLETFKAARNGFLINDYCVFGVEVYDVKYTGLGEALKMVDDPQEVTFEWKVRDFSTIYEEQLQSEKFRGGKHKWLVNMLDFYYIVGTLQLHYDV